MQSVSGKDWHACRIVITEHFMDRAIEYNFPDDILDEAVYEGRRRREGKEINGVSYEVSFKDQSRGDEWNLEVVKGTCFVTLKTVERK